MLVDRYGKNCEADDWFIRLDQNNEGRVYRVVSYPEKGRIIVHEHEHVYAEQYSCGGIIGITPKAKQQNILLPRSVVWYPRSLLPKLIPLE